MSSQRERNTGEAEPTAERVADYLQRHRDFFEQWPELLAELKIPHETGDATSLIERQVDVLRERNRQLDDKLGELVEVARANEQLLSRMRRLTLALLEARGMDEVLNAVQDVLRGEFDVDEVAMLIYREGAQDEEVGPARFVDPRDARLQLVGQVRESGEPKCGRPEPGQAEFLFDARAERVASMSLIPMGPNGSHGILAAGSHREERFNPAMGTLFLGYIGELVGASLAHYVG